MAQKQYRKISMPMPIQKVAKLFILKSINILPISFGVEKIQSNLKQAIFASIRVSFGCHKVKSDHNITVHVGTIHL